MIQSIRELRKIAKQRLKEREIVRDEEGRAVVFMTVRDDSAFLSPFSYSGKEVVSEEVASFLEKGALSFPPEQPVAVHIHSNCIDETEQKVYTEAIHETFLRQYAENEKRMRKNAIDAIILFAVGVVGFLMMAFLMHFTENEILIEIADIFAWVFIWESVDVFFIERSFLRMNRRRYLALSHCKTQFFALKNE
ncbi:MAG: hypothetical protein J5993_04120 [Clostridia bacterium]|nr:hypothetical protein [Clostridia bacterium]